MVVWQGVVDFLDACFDVFFFLNPTGSNEKSADAGAHKLAWEEGLVNK